LTGRLVRAGTAGPLALGLLAAVTLVKFVVILSAPPELSNNNEERMAAYVLDAVEGGNWTAPRDDSGRLMAKPPLYAWLAAVASRLLGGLSRGALYLPSALGVLLCAVVVFVAGRGAWGWPAGLYGGLAYLLSTATDKQLSMSRYDALFAGFVALAALAAWRAWRAGTGWTWFWLAAAGATLTKGPLGILLGALGLLAAAWERASGDRAPVRGSHRAGVALFLAIVGGWFTLAWLDHGRELVDVVLLDELVGHAVGDPGGEIGFYRPPGFVLELLLPWSLLAVVGSWRVVARPSEAPVERRFERFVFCWLWVGLMVFVLASHHRERLVLPLLPAAALLAGRELAGWLGRLAPRWRAVAVAGAVVAWVSGTALFYHLVHPSRPDVAATAAMRDAARALEGRVGRGFPLTHADTPFAFRYYLGQVRAGVTPARAAELLGGDAPVFVAVRDTAALQAALAGGSGGSGPDRPRAVSEVWRWPSAGPPRVGIVSNQPALARADPVAWVAWPFAIRAAGAEPAKTRRREVSFRTASAAWSIQVVNLSPRPERVTIRVGPPVGRSAWTRTLLPQETWPLP
jgi:4-amino-4-deoxy-L-arabinose transferase-like glycosyltransferase